MGNEFTMGNLLDAFDYAEAVGDLYIGVLIQMEGFLKPELIINKNENFDSKLEYYKKTYDENCNHKFAKGIKIIGVESGDYMEDFEELMYD